MRFYAKVKVAYLVLVHISTLAFVTLYGFNDRFCLWIIVDIVVKYLAFLHQITKHCDWFEYVQKQVRILSFCRELTKLRCTCIAKVIIQISIIYLSDLELVSNPFDWINKICSIQFKRRTPSILQVPAIVSRVISESPSNKKFNTTWLDKT